MVPQRKGLGNLIMQDMIRFIESKILNSCYISLTADGEACKLNEKYGFKDTFPKSKGIDRWK